MELLGKVRDRRICPSKLLQNAASRGVRERPKRGIEVGVGILNQMVQSLKVSLDASFAALSDTTRRGVLEQLGRSDASITAFNWSWNLARSA